MGESDTMGFGERFLNLPIRFKLIISYSIVFVSAIAVTNLFVYFIVRQTINNSIDNELKRSTSTILNLVKTSADTSVKAYLNGIAVQNRNMALYYYEQFKKGAMTESEAKQKAVKILLNQPVGETGYIYCLNSSGVIAVHPEKELVNTDLSDYAFIQYQKKHKQGYVEYDWKNPGDKRARAKALYMIYFEPWDWIISASSYRSEFARLVQVNDFKDQILTLAFGETGYSYIVNTDEQIIIHPQIEQQKLAGQSELAGRPGLDMEQLKKTERIATVSSTKNGKLTYPVRLGDGLSVREKVVVFNHISQFDWIVVSVGFMDELYAPLRTLKTVFIVTILLVLVVVLPLSYSISNSITNPLSVLMDRFSRAAKGDRSVRIQKEYNDEVGTLGQYFNQFMIQLEKQSQSLEAEIAEQKKTQKEMARFRLYLSAIVDSMPSVLIGVDTKGVVTIWNMEAEKISQVPAKKARGQRLNQVFPGLDIVMEMVVMANANRQLQVKERLPHPFMSEGVWADIVVYPLTRDVGHGCVIRIDDVSARVKMKDLMVQTQKMRTIAGLSAGMAHEINNPIGCIVQSAQNIIRRVSPELEANKKAAKALGTDLDTIHAYLEKRKVYKFLEDIRTSVDRTAKTVSNMLGFSRKNESVKSAMDLPELIESSVGLAAYDYELKKKYNFKGFQIDKKFDKGLRKVLCIPGQIEQVVLNLLKNAVQAVWENKDNSSPPKIKIRVTQRGKSVKLVVEDNGPGMEEHVKKRIFEPFFTTKSKGSGTGLGLSVAYYIVTRTHNGTFSVRSEPGKGAAFIVTLPCEE